LARRATTVFDGQTSLAALKRQPDELVSYLFRENSFPSGCYLLTGTGIVPGSEFTLAGGDTITISIGPIGTLENTVR
jgi:2-dehydro-3-deoxy-D-arabinonate dehydratase